MRDLVKCWRLWALPEQVRNNKKQQRENPGDKNHNLYNVLYTGKSTLLDVLSGRLDSEELKGVITANGAAIDRKEFRKVSGYVMQSDALFPLLTVRETFQFAAYLRIPNKTRAQKKAVAEEFINLLRLQKAADTIVGDDDNRGVSGLVDCLLDRSTLS